MDYRFSPVVAAHVAFEVDKLNSGEFAIRPKGQLGTIGWSPKPWTCVVVKDLNKAFDKFFAANEQWSWDDFIDPVWGTFKPEYVPERKVCANTYWLAKAQGKQ